MMDAVDMDGHVPFIFEQQFHAQSSELEEMTETEMDSCNGNVIEIKPIEDEIKDERVFDDVNIQPVSNIDANVAIASISTENEFDIPKPENDDWHIEIEGCPEDKNDAFVVDSSEDEIVDVVGCTRTDEHDDEEVLEVDVVGCSDEEESPDNMCVCTECGKAFKGEAGLAIHVLYHKNRKKIGCTVCGKVMPNETDLSIHMTVVHSNCRMFACGECGEAFTTELERNMHKKHIHNIIPDLFPCKQCGKVFRVKASLKKHMQEHRHSQVPKRYPCDSCDMVFSQLRERVNHINRNHNPGKLTCIECGVIFRSYSDQRRHLKAHRLGRFLLYPCGVCDKVFEKESRMRYHWQNVHGKADSWTKRPRCKICKITLDKNDMARHMETHDRDQRQSQEGLEMSLHHACEVCGEEFERRSKLNLHRYTHHTGYCTICEVRFPTSGASREHTALNPGHTVILLAKETDPTPPAKIKD